MLTPRRRRFHLKSGPQQRFQFRLHIFDARAILHREIDAIEPAPPAEHFLRGVNVHDGQVPSERACKAARFHDAPHREQLLALHGAHGNFAANSQLVLLRERVGDDERIRLREKNQRVVDHRFVAALQIVLTQAPVARHIHAQDQQIALPGKPGVNHRFNHGNGNANFPRRLHAIQHVLVKARFTGGNLELRRSSDAIHRLPKSVQHGLIGGVHSHKHGHAQHDPRDGQQPA